MSRVFLTGFVLTMFGVMSCTMLGVPVKWFPLIALPFVVGALIEIWGRKR